MRWDELINNARFTIFLGKNGSGKSTLLRQIDSFNNSRNTKYISPERGGTLKEDPNVATYIANDQAYIARERRKNRSDQFRQQSIILFRNLELLVLREIEKNRSTAFSFDQILNEINNLLPEIELHRSDRGFIIHTKDGEVISEDQISSGEVELISLAIEVLVFSRENIKNRVLLLDEPDVHLHPDLQQKFVRFIEDIAVNRDFKIVIATHSTAIIGAFTKHEELQIVPISNRKQSDYKYFNYSKICHELLPIFGAHPLSSEFNRSPILLVEGEDDRRVIEQWIRSSNGNVKFSPCAVGTVDEMMKWESWLSNFLPSIYNEPKAFSLRDLDNSEQSNIENVGCVSRARLNCYEMENLLLTDECLAKYNHQPSTFLEILNSWASNNPNHQAYSTLKSLIDQFEKRRVIKIKDARNVLVGLLGTEKPWEVIIGQLLAEDSSNMSTSENSIRTYLGSDAISKLNLLNSME